MSIDFNWETVTGGPDGQELAHKIRDFIHDKFQAIPLPRFIKSVTVHNFEFGSIPPELELKDITDPLPDFYEENPELDAEDLDDDDDDNEDGDGRDGGNDDDGGAHMPAELRAATERRRRAEAAQAGGTAGGTATGRGGGNRAHPNLPPHLSAARNNVAPDSGSPFLGVSIPGVPGGTLNLHYFHSQFATGLPGSHTPLAAVAGAQHLGSGLTHSSSAPDLHRQFSGSGAGPVAGVDGSPATPNYGYGYGHGHGHGRNTSQSSISIGDNSSNSPVQRLAPGPFPPPPGPPPGPGPATPGSAIGLGIASALREKHSVSTLAPTSAGGGGGGGASRPPTRDTTGLESSSSSRPHTRQSGTPHPLQQQQQQQQQEERERQEREQQEREREEAASEERRAEDIQAVFRIRYAGDVKLQLTTDILLDYPMPSFVGIPVRLSITGLTFDGVGVVAYIRRRVHFCFLSPEDALAAVGTDGLNDNSGGNQEAEGGSGSGVRPSGGGGGRLGGLLQEIRVESEIGQRESGKQSLKNVGKVERFVLEQVRRIFEEEFVYPSFWTFLV